MTVVTASVLTVKPGVPLKVLASLFLLVAPLTTLADYAQLSTSATLGAQPPTLAPLFPLLAPTTTTTAETASAMLDTPGALLKLLASVFLLVVPLTTTAVTV